MLKKCCDICGGVISDDGIKTDSIMAFDITMNGKEPDICPDCKKSFCRWVAERKKPAYPVFGHPQGVRNPEIGFKKSMEASKRAIDNLDSIQIDNSIDEAFAKVIRERKPPKEIFVSVNPPEHHDFLDAFIYALRAREREAADEE